MKKQSNGKLKAIFCVIAAALVFVVLLFAYDTFGKLSRMTKGTVPIVAEESSGAPIDPSVREVLINDAPTVDEQAAIHFREAFDTDIVNILLLGLDTPDGSQARSDTMILLSYNRRERTAHIVSLMRDILLPIEGYGQSRLGHTYAFGGAGLCLNTVNQNFTLDVQRYITVSFDGLVSIIDDIGGIDLPLSAAEAQYYNELYHWEVTEGTNHLDGKMALRHARNRTLGDDFERTRRQRDILKAAYEKALNLRKSRNALQLLQLLDKALPLIGTNMSTRELLALGLDAASGDTIAADGSCIPISGTYRGILYRGMSVLEIDLDKNRQYLHALLYPDKQSAADDASAAASVGS